jgi:lipooligosaccharide transport system permease protein
MTALALRVVEREARVYRRMWRGSFFSSFVSPLLYLGAMGVGLGGLVDARSQGVDGIPYLQFVAPGLLAATALQTAAAESLWPVMAGTKWLRTFHAMVSAPMRASDVFLGTLVWLGVRLTVMASAFLVVATAFGGIRSAWGVLAVPAAILTGVAIGAPVTAYAATQEQEANFGLLMRLIVLPLFLFSGTFFPVDQLPAALQPLVALSPLWHGVELCRAATTGQWPEAGAAAVVTHVAVLVGVALLGAFLGTRAFARRLTA